MGITIFISEQSGKWTYNIIEASCTPYSNEWIQKLSTAIDLPARDYQQLHADYGHFIGKAVNDFIEKHHLQYKIALVSSHGHTTFHNPAGRMTGQIGDGAAIAAETRLPVVTDLRAMDVAFGGQGAPIVPIGEKLLLGNHRFFLNLGGIANISHNTDPYIAFDICPANRVLNLLAAEAGKEYDDGGKLAETGAINENLLKKLNELDYYQLPYPKSLANDFGTDIVYPIIRESAISTVNALRTFAEHIAVQIKNSIINLNGSTVQSSQSILITGGGALNHFLVKLITEQLKPLRVNVEVPAKELVNFKEAMIMGFIGVLRWRQEYNVFSSVTGASGDSIGGALWNGQDA